MEYIKSEARKNAVMYAKKFADSFAEKYQNVTSDVVKKKYKQTRNLYEKAFIQGAIWALDNIEVTKDEWVPRTPEQVLSSRDKFMNQPLKISRSKN